MDHQLGTGEITKKNLLSYYENVFKKYNLKCFCLFTLVVVFLQMSSSHVLQRRGPDARCTKTVQLEQVSLKPTKFSSAIW